MAGDGATEEEGGNRRCVWKRSLGFIPGVLEGQWKIEIESHMV